jgi:hypothetical protein
MKIENIQHRERRNVIITVRVTKTKSDWLKSKNISPSALFNSAIDELQELAEEQ